MNDEQKELARRLARCPQYKPEPVTADYTRRLCGTRVLRDTNGTLIPDLTDAATGGVLWEMADRPGVGPCRAGMVTVSQWTTGDKPRLLPYDGATLAEACARALLAEWGEA